MMKLKKKYCSNKQCLARRSMVNLPFLDFLINLIFYDKILNKKKFTTTY